MTASLKSISKRAAYALRHAPAEFGLELDDDGWVAVASLAKALDTGIEELAEMVASSPKNRYEMRDGRIRARYGHSVPQRIRREPIVPPPTLYHGTSPEAVEAILRDGLQPKARQYVHLAIEPAMATEVGRRKAGRPVLLVVDAGAAQAAGIAFYRGNEHVVLADAVPPRFIRKASR